MRELGAVLYRQDCAKRKGKMKGLVSVWGYDTRRVDDSVQTSDDPIEPYMRGTATFVET